MSIPPGIILDYTNIESGFVSLTKLMLWGSPLHTHEFLAFARPKALQYLAIEWEFKPVADQSPLIANIAAITHLLPSSPFLQHFRFQGDRLSSLSTDSDELWSMFEPLLELKQLEDLDYTIPLPTSDPKTARSLCMASYPIFTSGLRESFVIFWISGAFC
ncbi:hypothetical protein BDP27DRAFT_274155 [Rhodocollybia butyracea]|uniref:Uncharacterized protein n=1 Tax=Rhodocollybia butyracea TaxID=206335 RepID=A0A9P5U1U5_9AGAR|nr:hypothetical protein BDP27DRAFT_274155 [Rhodocollybia butyracea]